MSNVRPGPKGAVEMSPLPLTRYPKDRVKRLVKFAGQYLRTPKGEGVRQPFRFRPWQVDLLHGFFAPGVRSGLASLPRGNGKSTLAAALAVFELFTVEAAQVVVIASDQRQAGIILNTVRRMIELHPNLACRARLLKDHIEVPGTGSEMYALPSDPGALQGWDPSLCILDELHFINTEVFEAITGFAGKREQSLTLAISTPSDRHDSVMKTLVDLGRSGSDPSFFFREWTSDPDHPVDCEHCWELANPALDDFLFRDGLRSLLGKMRESSFRRYRLGQWVAPVTAWLTELQWKACEDKTRTVARGEEIVCFFDGSFSDDSTALVACTVDNPHIFVVGLWEKPADDDEWRVPRLDVSRIVDATFKTYRVRELACDPYGWRSEIERWARKYGKERVIEYPTNVRGRMGPATDRATEAVIEQRVTHDGNPDLARHVLNCTVTHTKYGDLVHKEHMKSARKIDAAVCAIGALDRAAWHANNKPAKRTLRVVNGGW